MDNLEYAKGWKPDEGDVLIGVITAVDSGWSDYRKGNYPIITVQPDFEDGQDRPDEVAVHCFHAALFNRVMSVRPMVGERIGVQYQGKRQSKQDSTREVAVYVLRVDRKNDDPYARIAGSTPTPQALPPSDIPADVSDFKPDADAPADDDIPF